MAEPKKICKKCKHPYDPTTDNFYTTTKVTKSGEKRTYLKHTCKGCENLRKAVMHQKRSKSPTFKKRLKNYFSDYYSKYKKTILRKKQLSRMIK